MFTTPTTTPGYLALAALTLVASLLACSPKSDAPNPDSGPQTEEQITLYALGMQLADLSSDFKLREEELPWVQKGLRDRALGAGSPIDPSERGAQIQALLDSRLKISAEAETILAEEYMQQMAKEEGARLGEEGWVLRTLEEGTGEGLRADDTINAVYEVRLRDGKLVDSTKGDEGKAVLLYRVIPCFPLALVHARVGGHYKLSCPPHLAHGDRGMPPAIPGGAALTYDIKIERVELILRSAPVQPEPAAPAAPPKPAEPSAASPRIAVEGARS